MNLEGIITASAPDPSTHALTRASPASHLQDTADSVRLLSTSVFPSGPLRVHPCSSAGQELL